METKGLQRKRNVHVNISKVVRARDGGETGMRGLKAAANYPGRVLGPSGH